MKVLLLSHKHYQTTSESSRERFTRSELQRNAAHALFRTVVRRSSPFSALIPSLDYVARSRNIVTIEIGNNLLGDRAAQAFGEALAHNDTLEGACCVVCFKVLEAVVRQEQTLRCR